MALVALTCPLVCLGLPLLAATGLARAVQGTPWPLVVGAVLAVLALGLWRLRTRRTRACALPTPTTHDGTVGQH
jgi:hypothetical protein